jgi:curli biogenesis system outer membrane secretion channel CsgG
MIVGVFQNRSAYQNGLFASGTDRLGTQAKTILSTHLQQTGRFSVMDRANMESLASESKYANTEQQIEGAKYVLTGDVTEFGRRVTGDQQLFGILGSSKTQTAYSKVALQVVDVRTSEVVFSVQGGGTYELTNREVLGTGGTSGYDSTLNGKVLNLAITEAVDRLVEGLENGEWSAQ